MQSSTSAAPPRPPAGSTDADRLERARRLKAIGLMCIAVTCFSGLDASAKYLVGVAQLPTTQVVWVRFFGQFMVVLFVLGAISVPRLLRTRRLKFQMARSLLLVSSTAFNFLALRELRLDQTTTLQFLAPLMVALFAGPLLGEWVGWRRMTAIAVGFVGILIVIRPGVATFQPALIFALCSVLSYALFMLVTRYLSAFDPPEVTLFYSLLAGTYLAAPLAMVDWVWPTQPLVWLLLATMGLWAGLGHYIFILAYRLAPASTVAPFLYVQLLSMTALGYVVFGDVPDLWTLVGAAIVIASGVYLVYREQKVKSGGR